MSNDGTPLPLLPPLGNKNPLGSFNDQKARKITTLAPLALATFPAARSLPGPVRQQTVGSRFLSSRPSKTAERLPGDEYESAFSSDVRRSLVVFCVVAVVGFIVSLVFFFEASEYMSRSDMTIDGTFAASKIRALESLVIGDAAAFSALSPSYVYAPTRMQSTLSLQGSAYFANVTTMNSLRVVSAVVTGHLDASNSVFRNNSRLGVVSALGAVKVSGDVVIGGTLQVYSLRIHNTSSFSGGLYAFSDISVAQNASFWDVETDTSLSTVRPLAVRHASMAGGAVIHGNVSVAGNAVFSANRTIFNGLSKIEIDGSKPTSVASLVVRDSLLVYRDHVDILSLAVFSKNVTFGGAAVIWSSLGVNESLFLHGPSVVSGTLFVSNSVYAYGPVFANQAWTTMKNSTFTSELLVDNNATIGGNVSVSQWSLLRGSVQMLSPFSVGGSSVFYDRMNTSASLSVLAGAFTMNKVDVYSNTSVRVDFNVSDVKIQGLSNVDSVSFFYGASRMVSSVKLENLTSYGDVSIGSNFTQVGGASVNMLKVDMTLDVIGSTFFGGSISFNSSVFVLGQSVHHGNLSVKGNTLIMGYATSAPPLIAKDVLNVTGDVTLRDSGEVYGMLYGKGNFAALGSSFSNGSLLVSSNFLIQRNVTVNGRLSVTSSSLFAGRLRAQGNVLVAGSVAFSNDVSALRNAQMVGSALLSAVSVQVDATFQKPFLLSQNLTVLGGFEHKSGAVRFLDGLTAAGPIVANFSKFRAGLSVLASLAVQGTSSFDGGSSATVRLDGDAVVNNSAVFSPFLNVSGTVYLLAPSGASHVSVEQASSMRGPVTLTGSTTFGSSSPLILRVPFTIASSGNVYAVNNTLFAGWTHLLGVTAVSATSMNVTSQGVFTLRGPCLVTGAGSIDAYGDANFFGDLEVSSSSNFVSDDASKSSTFKGPTTIESTVDVSSAGRLDVRAMATLSTMNLTSSVVISGSWLQTAPASFTSSVSIETTAAFVVHGPASFASAGGVIFYDVVQIAGSVTAENTVAFQAAPNMFLADMLVQGSMTFSGSVASFRSSSFLSTVSARASIFKSDRFSAFSWFETPRVESPYEIEIYDGSPATLAKRCRLGCLHVELPVAAADAACILYIDTVTGCT